MRRYAVRAILLGATLIAAPSFALAEDFYAGKDIKLIIGSGVGGGYDTYARLTARHWPKHIPGSPNIVPQNMPGAGSLAAMNTLANSAPRDGTTVGAVQTHIGVEPIMGVTGAKENAKYDGRKMTWIGSAAKEIPVVVLSDKAPVKTFADLLTTPVVVGASGVATADSVYARILNALVGTKFKIIDGYKGNPQMIMATEAGEIMGRAGWFVSSLLTTQSQPLEQGKLRVMVQVAAEKHPDLPNVPLVTEFIKDPDKRAKFEFAVSWLPMGRPIVAPPDLPPERAKLLRDSYMATMKDPELLAEAKKMKLEISPMSGQEVQALIEKLYKTPPAVIEDVRAIMVAR